MTHRIGSLAFIISVTLGLCLFPSEQLAPASQAQTITQEIMPLASQPLTNKELIQNGGFDRYGQFGEAAGWVKHGSGSGVNATAGQDLGPAMQIEGITEPSQTSPDSPYLYQALRLPTQTTAATFSFDYGMSFPDFPGTGTAAFSANIASFSNNAWTALATPLNVTFTPTAWQHVNYPLSAAEVTSVQAAHERGEQVFAIFTLSQSSGNVARAFVDNVSFEVSGSMNIPESAGSIAYVGLDAGRHAVTVKSIEPDASNPQTLWTHPSTIPETNSINDVAWKPDGTELAFSSNHDSAHSRFHSDVYGIKPDGNSLRRITNPPSRAELDAGSYQFGAVTGSVLHDYFSPANPTERVSSFLLYIEGAKEAVSISIATSGDVDTFTVPEVADLGVGLHYVVFMWASDIHENCREFAAAVVDVEPGNTVDVGQLSFTGVCGSYYSSSVSWKRDGSQIAVDVLTPKKFLATGQTTGTDLFSGAPLANNHAWSPTDDQILYFNQTVDTTTSGIYLTTDGGSAGTRLVADNGALWVTPAWLPDGSGFVFTIDHEIWQHTLSSGQNRFLASLNPDYAKNPSVSPDGKYVVFEWWSSLGTPQTYDLWILDLSNPVEMWPLTSDGRSSNPDWSRVDPTVPGPTCTTLSGVSISGDASGSVSQDYIFTANVAPSNAGTPITYVWNGDPKSGQGTKQATYNWDSSGSQKIDVTVKNCNDTGSAQATHTIVISDTPGQCTAVQSVTISGDANGIVSQDYTFKANVSPSNAGTPITFVWNPAPKNGDGTEQATYNWGNSGSQKIDVTVKNCSGAGSAQDAHDISISATCTPLTGAAISGPATGSTGQNYEFTASATPANATGPFTYSWTPAPDLGQDSMRAVYQWDTEAKHKVSVSMTNCGGSGTAAAEHEVTISTSTSTGNTYLPYLSR